MAPGKRTSAPCWPATIRRLLLGAVLLLTGCAGAQGRPDLPYDSWYVGVTAPEYMEVWIESVDVIDRRGLVYEHVHGGIAAYMAASGWQKLKSSGGGKRLPGIDLPEIIFVRWQSLVEPQTYNVRINIPEWVREEMLKPRRAQCRFDGKWFDGLYRNHITIGLAPGGIAKAWVGGSCLKPIEIGRFKAAVSKLGPSQGKTGGRYALPLSPEAKAYIEQHGVPYGSW